MAGAGFWRACLCGLIVLVHGTVLVAREAPPLMLAQTYRGDGHVTDYWISEKLDGVRGYWDGQQLITRGGHRIIAPAAFTHGWPAVPMDGELWIARGRFDEVSGIVRRKTADADDWQAVRYWVFDLPAHPGTFDERLAALKQLIEQTNRSTLTMVAQFRLPNAAALQARLDAVVADGGEGLMLHRADARYQARRTGDLLKLKQHDDAEARVIGYQPGRGKYEGVVGALLVEDVGGRRFRLGSGLSDALRIDPPPLGSWVTYRYTGLTGEGLPRFARLLRVREELPPPDPS